MIHQKTIEKITELLQASTGTESPGYAVGIMHQGEVVWEGGFGLANLEHGLPITPETVFDVGSIAKQFVGAAIASLESTGDLSLADPLHRYLPDFATCARTVTLGDLVFQNHNPHFCAMDLVYNPTIRDHFIAYDPNPITAQMTFLRKAGSIWAFVYRDYDGDGREVFHFVKQNPKESTDED